MAVDIRTEFRNWPLPDLANKQIEDIPRLIMALQAADADVGAILLALAGKAAATHGHSIPEITGLAEALAAKAAADHNHEFGSLVGVNLAGAVNGQSLRRVGGIWVPSTIANNNVSGLESALAGKVSLYNGTILVPFGTTGERPEPPADSYLMRYNSTTKSVEFWDGVKWGKIGGGAVVGETPPDPAQNGDFWFHSGLGVLSVFFVDASGPPGQWIAIGAGLDPSLILVKASNLADLLDKDAAILNLGANANGRDIFKNASTLGATLAKIADAAAGRTAIGAAPLPQTAAGVGQFVIISTANGSGFNLPAGGTWLYFRIYVSATNGGTVPAGGATASIAAGGTAIAPGTAGVYYQGFALRIT